MRSGNLHPGLIDGTVLLIWMAGNVFQPKVPPFSSTRQFLDTSDFRLPDSDFYFPGWRVILNLVSYNSCVWFGKLL
ncbi:MAG TPA: hypothetical protein GX520_09320 [Syntrophaceticus sp.]|nr:hypothetical protein [Syntrophaceticus sp.]